MDQNYLNPVFKLKHVFGMNQIKNGLKIFEKNEIFYLAGHNIIKYDVIKKSQNFISGNENYKKITSIAMSQDKKFLAVAETGLKPIIHIFNPSNLRKRKFLALIDNSEKIKEFVDLKFQNDTFLFSIGRGEKCFLFVWNFTNWQIDLKYELFKDFLYDSLDFCFYDKNIFCVVGKENISRLYKIEKKEKKEVKVICENMYINEEDPNFSCVKFLKNEKSILFKNGKKIILCSIDGKFLKFFFFEKTFNFFSPSKNGFFIFFDNLEFSKFEITKNTELKEIKTYKDNQNNKLTYTSFDFDESKQTGYFITSNCTLIKFDSNKKTENFKKISEDNHIGPILDLSIAIKKPYIATCSIDKKIKIWNYQNYTLVNDILLNEDPLGVEFHPSGLHIAISFSEKVCIMNLYPKYFNNKKKGTREINLKNISKIKFSEGGDKLAIAAGNSQIIYIFKFYTCEKMQNLILKGHSGKIVSLKFCKNDSVLYSCGADGIVYEWNLKNGQRIEIITKGSPINDLTYNPEIETLFIATDNKESLLKYNDKPKKIDCGIFLSQVCISSNYQMLFGGAGAKSSNCSGIVRYFKNFVNLDFYENYQAHDERGVSRIDISFNNFNLISCGNDGLICIFVIQDLESAELKNQNFMNFSNEILVTKNEIEELTNKKESLTTNYYDNTFQNNNLMTLNNLDDEIKLLKEQLVTKENKEKKYIEKTKNLKEKIQKELEEKMNLFLQSQEDEIHEVEHNYNKEISREATKLEETIKKFDEFERDNTLKSKLIKKDFEKMIKNLEEKYKEKIIELEEDLEKVMEEKKHVTNINKIKLDIIEKETEFEKGKIEDKYNKIITNKKEESLKIKNQAIALKKKKLKFLTEIDKLKGLLNDKTKSLEPLKSKLTEMKILIKKKNEILLKKNRIINEKEKKIYLLKKETQELEKYKYVLDYTINDLNQEIAPKEEEITNLKILISKEDERLKNFNNINTNLETIVQNLQKSSLKMNTKIKTSKEKLRKINIKIDNLKNFIFNAVQEILDYKKVKEKLKKFPLKKIQEKSSDNQIDFEYVNQIKHLDNTVYKFRLNIKKDTDLHMKDNREYVAQNIKLIKEILKLRKELKCLKETEKPETIILRKNKRLRNIMNKKDRMLSYEDKVELMGRQEQEIVELKTYLFSLENEV